MEMQQLRTELRRRIVGDQVHPVIRRLVTELLDKLDEADVPGEGDDVEMPLTGRRGILDQLIDSDVFAIVKWSPTDYTVERLEDLRKIH